MIAIAPAVPAPRRSPAHAWFENNLPELTSRCHAFFHWMRPDEHEEAVADTLARVFQNACRLADRGRLDRMTPFTAVRFFGRSYRAGRQFTGTNSTDVLADRTRELSNRTWAMWSQMGLQAQIILDAS